MGSPISETWVYATMIIKNEWDQLGTGFLVFRPIDEKQGKIFLVTNKHVINEKKELRERASEITIFLNIKKEDGTTAGEVAKLLLSFKDGQKKWREHPERDVDVLAIDITDLIVKYPQIEKKWAGYSDFGVKEKLQELDVTIGDEIMVIGYPMGLKHRTTNFPLVRSGIIATKIGESLEDEIEEEDGEIRKRTLRGFLIDGATIPGSSGSPIVLKPVPARFTKKGIIMGGSPAILLGMLAETRYAPIRVGEGVILSFAGLGLAFDAETIKETIELFFN
jgi:S1-C subfamily serine protease